MRGMSKKDALACQVSLGLFAGLLGIASTAHGAPIADGGGVKQDGVRTGGAKIVQSGATTNITSDNTNNVIGWKDFSIKTGESVVFDNDTQTNNYLNIVTGKVTSHIDGTMKGGKNVYIANSHGVIFGNGASVDVGNLYVTTRKLDADAIGTSVKNGTINLDAPTSAGVKDNIINGDAASSEGLAKSDIVSLVDGSGSVKATKIVLEGKSVRIMNDAKIDSPNVSAVADQSALEVEAGGKKTVRAHKGYVHVGYETTAPTHGSAGKYKNLDAANMYKLVEDKAGLDAIRANTASLAGNYMLRKDIDFENDTHTSIGTNADPFTGKFDGMFHEIKNMTVASGNATDYAGLFGNTIGAEIANVGIRDANLSTLDYGGAVVGRAGKGTHIFNVYNEVTGPAPAATKTIGSTGGHEVGGIVGRTDGGSNSGEEVSLDNAYNTAAIETGAAGLVGYIKGMSRVYAVYNAGKLNSATTSQAGYQSMEGTSFIKNAYTSQGARLGDSDASLNAYDSYATSTGKAKLLNTTKVTGTAVDDKDAKQASSYGAWDISDEGGANATWRLFAGHSNPLLTAFMQGTVQAEYSYADFEQANHGHSGNVANTYTKRIDGTLKTNNGESMPERTYDATYRKMTKADGTEIGNISDVTIHGYPSPAPAAPNNIELNANHGRRNAGKEAMLYSGQHGYDVAGANIDIKKRSVKAGLGTDRPIEREYNGLTDMTQAFKDALTGITTDGLVAGDDVAADITGLTADTADANAGYGKTLTLGGTLTFTGNDRVNYEDIDANSGNMTLPSDLTANIRQKKVTVGLDTTKNYSKTYDGTSAVKSGVDPKTTNDVLQLTGVVGTEDLKLNYNDITAKYMTGKGASDKERSHAGTNIDIAYKNIKLANGTTGKAKNYRLVDAAGNVLYRDSLAGEPTDMTNAANSADPRYIGAATTAGGTLWGKGDINKRNISADTFLWDGGAVTKVYDGNAEWIKPNGASDANKKITAKKAEDTGVADEGLIKEDVDKIDFTLESGKGEFRKDDGTTATKNVSEAKKVAYRVTATNKNADDDVLSNYKIGGVDAVSGGKYDVTGEGKITPRVIDVDLLKKTGIDKTYDGTVDAVEGDDDHKYLTMGKNWVGYAGTGRLVGDTDGNGVGTDGAKVTAKAVYRQKGTTTDDKNVARAANKSVIENGKDVYYTFKLEGGNAATNYTFNADGITPQAEKNATGTGTITPKKLTATIGTVTRGYNGTSDLDVSRVALVHPTLSGTVGTDVVSLNTGSGSTIRGTYYKTSAKSEKAVNRGTGYTVAYTGLSSALVGTDSGNYWIDDVYDGLGDITKAFLTAANFHMNLHSKVQKRYDMTNQAFSDGLKNVTLDGTQLHEGQYTFDQDGSR